MKKVISLLLSVTMLVGLFLPAYGVSAVSGEIIASGGPGSTSWEWELTADGTLTFSGSYILHYADQTKDPWYPYLQQIKRVVIGGTIDKIPAGTFCNYTQLEAVEVTHSHPITIGDYAFDNCVRLNQVDLGSSIKEIGASAFSGCSSLETAFLPLFNYPASIADYAFSGCEQLREVAIPGDVTLGKYIFAGCPELTTVYFCESASLYGFEAADNSFYGVTANMLYPPYPYPAKYLMKDYGGKLTWLETTEGICGVNARWQYDTEQKLLTVSGTGSMFAYSSGNETPWGSFHDEILKIQVKDGITKIPSYSFEYCKNATEVILPETLTSIYLNAFNDCEALNNLLLPASIGAFGETNFNYTYSFIRCPSLTDVYYLGTEEEWLNITNADKVENLSVEMTKHFLTEYSKTPTCTEDGVATYYTFEADSAYPGIYDANKKLISTPSIAPALGHCFTDYISNGDATCITDGTKTAKCDRCDETDTAVEQGSALGHSYHNGSCTVCGAPAPGVTLSGTVTDYGDGDVTVELWAEEAEAAAYTVTVVDGVYTLENVIPGSYSLKIKKPGHVTREYALTVGTQAMTQDVSLCRAGDVNGDGRINVLDVARIYAHVRGTDPLEGYALDCSDLNGDGRSNVLDVARSYAHVRGTDPLY